MTSLKYIIHATSDLQSCCIITMQKRVYRKKYINDKHHFTINRFIVLRRIQNRDNLFLIEFLCCLLQG